jgi:hypothetical protein
MMGYRTENGDILTATPDTLLVPSSLLGAANTLMKAQVINNTSNVWLGTCDVLEAPRLN